MIALAGFHWGKRLALGLILVAIAWSWIYSGSAIAAAICRQVEGHELCIQRITRSAKYYWEYRAVVAVDGQEYPLEIYDCRHHLRRTASGDRLPFDQQGLGSFICQLVD